MRLNKDVQTALRHAELIGGGKGDEQVLALALGNHQLAYRHELRLVRFGQADSVMVESLARAIANEPMLRRR